MLYIQSEKYYLRSLGEDARKDIADIHKSFPQLSKDIIFPDVFDKQKFFSSVFRIGSKGIRLWTHYDVGVCCNTILTIDQLQNLLYCLILFLLL